MIVFFSILLIASIANNGCVGPSQEIIYKDVPSDMVVVKRATLDKLLDELVRTKDELIQCQRR